MYIVFFISLTCPCTRTRTTPGAFGGAVFQFIGGVVRAGDGRCWAANKGMSDAK